MVKLPRRIVWSVVLLIGGCAHQSVNKVAIFDRRSNEASEVIELARHTGLYKLQMTAGETHVKTPLYLAVRWMQKGESLGFRKESDGSLIAIAGTQTIALDPLPDRATHIMWLNRTKKATPLGKSMRATAKFFGQAAIVGAVSAGVVGCVALEIWNLRDDQESSHDYGGPPHHAYRR